MTITPKMVDCILYNMHEWKTLLEALEPKTSSSIVMLPLVPGSASSQVEFIAVKRATISLVITCVERAIRRLPRYMRRLVRLKYRENWTHKMIAEELKWSERTIDRRVETVRACVARALATLGEKKLSSFWREIGAILSA